MNAVPTTGFKPVIRDCIRMFSNIPLLRPAIRPLSMAGLVPDPVWKRMPVDETFKVSVGARAFCYASCYRDDLGRSLYWKGIMGYEAETIPTFSSLAAE